MCFSFFPLVLLSHLRMCISSLQISLLDEASFLKASDLLKDAKGSGKPFGGVRLIIVGDFAQLPTVHKNSERPPPLFHHDIWLSCNFNVVYLRDMKRCVDDSSVSHSLNLLLPCCTIQHQTQVIFLYFSGVCLMRFVYISLVGTG